MELKRDLKPRHLRMIAIGGAIGTGLFVATGASLSTAGPGGAIAAYLIIGTMVYFVMTSLGEMATHMPIAGSFETYASRFIDPSVGFALGWNYWFSWAITVASELAASALLMKFWFPDVPSFYWSAIFLAILFGLNYLSTKAYGESEYWFAGIKVGTIIIFLVVGTLMVVGLLGDKPVGFTNLTAGDAPFVGGWPALISIMMIAGFSFQGTELVGIAAGESSDPKRNVPRAINTVFWRIMIFYVGAIVVVSCLIPYTDPLLLKTGLENISVSPFTLVFNRAGLTIAASVMNAVILTSVLSCGNSGLYAATRMLYAMAKEKKAPKILNKVNRRGVPINALLVTTGVGMFAFLMSLFGDGVVYIWLLNASGLTGFIIWLGIAVSHYRFRKAWVLQGKPLSDLKYKARLFPVGPIFAFILCTVVILGQALPYISGGKISWGGLLATFIGLIIFFGCWPIYKIVMKTKVVKLKDCNLEEIK